MYECVKQRENSKEKKTKQPTREDKHCAQQTLIHEICFDKLLMQITNAVAVLWFDLRDGEVRYVCVSECDRVRSQWNNTLCERTENVKCETAHFDLFFLIVSLFIFVLLLLLSVVAIYLGESNSFFVFGSFGFVLMRFCWCTAISDKTTTSTTKTSGFIPIIRSTNNNNRLHTRMHHAHTNAMKPKFRSFIG